MAIKLSIITPVRNGARHLANCLENVIQQASPEIEHIVVDGDSKDGTSAILHEYASRHSHIRWISEPDEGQSDATNKGTNLARGSAIGILNVDDCYEPGTLARVLGLFKDMKEPALVVGDCRVWGESGLLFVSRPRSLGLFALLLGRVHPLNPSAYFYHRSLHYLIGGYDINDHYSLDVDFLFRAVQVANVRYVPEVWGNFFVLPGTKTFEDAHNSPQRLRNMRKRYAKQLPLFQRLLLPAARPAFVAARGLYKLGKRLGLTPHDEVATRAEVERA